MASRRASSRTAEAEEEAGDNGAVPDFVRQTVIEALAVASLQQWHHLNDNKQDDNKSTKTYMPTNWWKDIRDNTVYQSMNISENNVRNRFRTLREKEKAAGNSTETGNQDAEPATGDTDTVHETDTATASTTQAAAPAPAPRARGGRPKGSTKAKKLQDQRNISAAILDATKAFLDEKSETKGPLPKGTLARLIETAKKNNNVPEETFISPDTIRTRAKRNMPEPSKTRSPMEEIEPLLLAVHHACYFANIHFNEKKFLRLANDIIKGTELEERVIQWKVQYTGFQPTEGEGAQLGRAYWQGFRRRHADEIENAKAKKKAKAAKDYATYANFLFAYDLIYGYMEEWGLAEKLQEAEHQNIDGTRVDDEKDAFGCIVEYYLKLPEWILVFDETGNSTNQDKLSNNQERGSVPKGMPLVESVAPNDRHYTIIPFNNLLGQLVCVTIIFASNDDMNIPAKWGCPIDWFRFDEFINGLEEEEQQELLDFMQKSNSEEEQIEYLYQHYGDAAKSFIHDGVGTVYNGQHIPYFKATSPKGSVTAKILRGTLAMLDELNVFERNGEHPAPMLICDGHGSRFDLDLLEYTTVAETRWLIVHGVPGCTSLWQAGDSSQMNGHFKMRIQQAETEYGILKAKYGLPSNITHCDVIPIISKAIPITFGVTENCKKAIAERGWNPLNKALLKLPEIVATKTEIDLLADTTETNSNSPNDTTANDGDADADAEQEEDVEDEPEEELDEETRDKNAVEYIVGQTNVADNSGFSGALLAEIFMTAEVQLKKERANARRRAGLGRAFQRTHKRITAGTNFFHGGDGTGTCIIDETTRDEKRRRRAAEKEQEAVALRKKKSLSSKLVKEVKEALRKQQDKQPLLVSDLKALCNWKRRKGKGGDGNLPSKRDELLSFFDRVKDHVEPVWPSLESDEEDEDEDEDEDDEEQLEDADATQRHDDSNRAIDDAQEQRLVDLASGAGVNSQSESEEEDEEEMRRVRKRQRYEAGNRLEDEFGGSGTDTSSPRRPRRRVRLPETLMSSDSSTEDEDQDV